AQGHFYRCDGPGCEFVRCVEINSDTQVGCEMGGDSILGNSNDTIGAGYCRGDVTNCFVNGGQATGGTTINGKGDATDTLSVAAFCIPATGNGAVNASAGLPGPGRIRQ